MTSNHVSALGYARRDTQQLATELEADLLKIYGPMVGGDALHRALGYPSPTAFRTALCKGQVPVDVFGIRFRRGKFALTKDVAAWLAKLPGASQSISEK